MTNSDRGYKTQYENLWKRYREDVIDWNEKEARLFYLYRSEMVTNAQLHKELEIARETIDALLYNKPVDNEIRPLQKVV